MREVKKFSFRDLLREKLLHELARCWNDEHPGNRPVFIRHFAQRCRMDLPQAIHDFFVHRDLIRIVLRREEVLGKFDHPREIVWLHLGTPELQPCFAFRGRASSVRRIMPASSHIARGLGNTGHRGNAKDILRRPPP